MTAGGIIRLWPGSAFADLLAGALTAGVFYAEYISLGVVLGGALPIAGGAALGSMMVVGAVLINCLLGAALRRPLLAGPRAASLAVLVAGMKFSVEHAAADSDRLAVAMAALTVMMLTGAAVQLAGLLPRVRAWLCCTSVALRKGFVFSTAVGIVVGLGSAQLDACLRMNPAGTVMVVALAAAAALGWSRWCRPAAGGPQWRGALAPFSLVIGVAVAGAGYYALLPAPAEPGFCGVLGAGGLHGVMHLQSGLSPAIWAAASHALPLWVWAVLVLLGMLMGLVLLLETLMALRESRDRTPAADWPAHIKLRALASLVCAPLGLVPGSISLARTNALAECGGRSRLALLVHGIGLVAIVFFLQEWIAALPQLAVAVALLLLAIQMIDEDTRCSVWRPGYSRHAVPAGVRGTWIFWGVVAVSLACGSVLHHVGWGFGGGPLIALFAGTAWTGHRFMKRRRVLYRLRRQPEWFYQ